MVLLVLALAGLGAWIVGGLPALANVLRTEGLDDEVIVPTLTFATAGLVWLSVATRPMSSRVLARLAVILVAGVGLYSFLAGGAERVNPALRSLVALGWAIGAALHLLVTSQMFRGYSCSVDGKWRRTWFSAPSRCPGPKGSPHEEDHWICPTCARASLLCPSCVSDHGCPTCRRDLSDQGRCQGPIYAPSQCLSSPRAGVGLPLCPTHSPERCPTCARIGALIAAGRRVEEKATCSLDGEGAGYTMEDGTDLGPVFHCYDETCNAVGHQLCLEEEGRCLCPKCELQDYRVPAAGVYYGPAVVLKGPTARILPRR